MMVEAKGWAMAERADLIIATRVGAVRGRPEEGSRNKGAAPPPQASPATPTQGPRPGNRGSQETGR